MSNSNPNPNLSPDPDSKEEYLLPEDSNEFGLTLNEYEILQEDILLAIEYGNKEYGILPLVKVKPRSLKKWERRTAVQKIAIEKGIIKVRHSAPEVHHQ